MQRWEPGEAARVARLEPPAEAVHIVLDTDAYNEVDDQFAITYAMLAQERMTVEAIYAAPFHRPPRSTGPAEGMQRSYEEIERVLDMLGRAPRGGVLRGSTGYLPDEAHPVESEAAFDLVTRAMAWEGPSPLYVVAIAAITNVASAILMEPAIIERIVVIWLAGHARHWPHTREFNIWQDPAASRVVLDCGVPLIRLPCMGVVSHLHTTVAELEKYVQGCGSIGRYLTANVRRYLGEQAFARSKVIWDIAAIAWLVNPEWIYTQLVTSPILTDAGTWSFDPARHLVRSAFYVERDAIFGDLFARLARL